MPRIRTHKPSFFRHEELSEIEMEHGDLKPMLVFEALWGHCDRSGVFEWKVRQLALEILPFVLGSDGEALGKTLMLLWHRDFIVRLRYQGKEYGWIPTLGEHQRFSGKEAKEKPRYPDPKVMEIVEHAEIVDDIPGEAIETQWGSNGEATGKTGSRNGVQEKETLPTVEATKRKRSAPTDPRTNHPAIQAVREITARYPDKAVWDALIDTLGETFDRVRLEECWKAWRVKGFSPTNYSWITEWYAGGTPAMGHRLKPNSLDANMNEVLSLIGDHHDRRRGPDAHRQAVGSLPLLANGQGSSSDLD